MNPRIKELAEQALFESDFDDEQNIKITMDIFAELVIRECLEQVRDEVQYEYDWKLADAVSERVKKHFGVEE